MGNINSGVLAPAGVQLVESDVWHDGNVVVRPSGTFTNNSSTGAISPVLTTAPTAPASGNAQYTTASGQLATINSDGLVTITGGVVQSQSSTVTVANTASATALQSFTVPANDPVAGAIYAMRGFGVYSDTGTPTLAFNLYWGGVAGTVLATIPAITLGSGVTNVPFSYRAIVNFRSTTSAWGNIELSLGTSASTAAANGFTNTTTTATAVTTNTTNALTLGVTWGTQSASNTISLFGGMVERLA